MSGETADRESGWTVDTLNAHLEQFLRERDPARATWTFLTLKEFLVAIITGNDLRYEQRFNAQQQALQDALVGQEKAVSAALQAADRAVIKAETASEKRFDAVNEFRATLADQAATLMPRAEAETRLNSFSDKLGEITDRINRSEGKSGGIASSWGILLGALGGIAILFTLARDLFGR